MTKSVETRDTERTPQQQFAPLSDVAGLTIVRVEFAFDDADLVPPQYPVSDASTDDNTVTIAGDHTDLFTAGATFEIVGGTNSGVWTVDTSGFGGGNTTITVVEALNTTGAGGVIVTVSTQVFGIPIHTPNPGDYLWRGIVSVPTEAWDGSNPRLALFSEGVDVESQNIATAALDSVNGSFNPHVANPAADDILSPTFLSDATRLMIGVTDGGARDPGAMQGSAVLTLVIIPA